METGTHHPAAFGGRTDTGATGEAQRKAKELTRTARDRALSSLDQQKGQVSALLERVADTIEDDRLGAYASDYARRGADLLRRSSAQELLDSVRRGLRSRPGLTLSACFVAGLAFARLMKGSMGDGGGARFDEGEYSAGRRFAESGYPGESGYREGSWARTERMSEGLGPETEP
jgi:hypothetical protein